VLVGFLHELLSFYVRLFDLGKVCLAPYEVKLTPEGAAREPDLFFVAREKLDRLTEDRLIGAPDLVIEIVSKSSVKSDRDDKFNEYRDAGVHEYWIIDPRPNKLRADFYRLSEQGIYRLFATEEDEQVSSDVLSGFWLRPAWLWKANVLNPIQCNFEIDGVISTFNKQIHVVQKSE
jgi:Uma2 family endonuclease